MRQADVRVGVVYAFIGNSYPEVVARIRPTAPAKNGQVEAELLDKPMLPKGRSVDGLTVKPGGKKCTVSTRRIYGTWDEWLAEVARREAVRARYEKESALFEAQIKDLTNPDPNRLVPQSYELQRWVGKDVRWDNSSREASRRLGEASAPFREWSRSPEQLLETAALFKDLPAGLCRDMVAALEDRENYQEWIEPHQARISAGATVVVALARAARLLNALRYKSSSLVGPDQFIDDADVAFVQAVVADVESRGGQFLLPFVPPLPPSSSYSFRHNDRSERACEVLGWIRLGIADTEGVKLHAVGCQHVREPVPGEQPITRPWWQVRISPARAVCGTCGGPGFASPLEVAHFVAASDVWAARGMGEIETWQRIAVVRLMNVTAEDALRKGEGQPSIDSLVAAALMKDLPGEEGDDAYRLFLGTPYGFMPHGLDEAAAARAITLARERMEVVRATLPLSVAPVELSIDATLEQVRERHKILSALVLEDCLDKFLFALRSSD